MIITPGKIYYDEDDYISSQEHEETYDFTVVIEIKDLEAKITELVAELAETTLEDTRDLDEDGLKELFDHAFTEDEDEELVSSITELHEQITNTEEKLNSIFSKLDFGGYGFEVYVADATWADHDALTANLHVYFRTPSSGRVYLEPDVHGEVDTLDYEDSISNELPELAGIEDLEMR